MKDFWKTLFGQKTGGRPCVGLQMPDAPERVLPVQTPEQQTALRARLGLGGGGEKLKAETLKAEKDAGEEPKVVLEAVPRHMVEALQRASGLLPPPSPVVDDLPLGLPPEEVFAIGKKGKEDLAATVEEVTGTDWRRVIRACAWVQLDAVDKAKEEREAHWERVLGMERQRTAEARRDAEGWKLSWIKKMIAHQQAEEALAAQVHALTDLRNGYDFLSDCANRGEARIKELEGINASLFQIKNDLREKLKATEAALAAAGIPAMPVPVKGKPRVRRPA